MNCKLCEEKSENDLCECCLEKLKTKIGMKCTRCGSYGFIPKSEKNIARLSLFIKNFVEDLETYRVTIVPNNGCLNCLESEIYLNEKFGGFTPAHNTI